MPKRNAKILSTLKRRLEIEFKSEIKKLDKNIQALLRKKAATKELQNGNTLACVRDLCNETISTLAKFFDDQVIDALNKHILATEPALSSDILALFKDAVPASLEFVSERISKTLKMFSGNNERLFKVLFEEVLEHYQQEAQKLATDIDMHIASLGIEEGKIKKTSRNEIWATRRNIFYICAGVIAALYALYGLVSDNSYKKPTLEQQIISKDNIVSLEEGYLYLQAGNTKKATEVFMYALKQFKASDDINGQARTQLYLGHLARMQSNNDEAYKAYVKAQALFQLTGDRLGEVSALIGINYVDNELVTDNPTHEENSNDISEEIKELKALYESTDGQSLNRNSLIVRVAIESDLTLEEAAAAVDAMFNSITNTLSSGNDVRLVGFGTFSVADRKSSQGRNPRTGEMIYIPASKQPKFKAGKSLKDIVNQKQVSKAE